MKMSDSKPPSPAVKKEAGINGRKRKAPLAREDGQPKKNKVKAVKLSRTELSDGGPVKKVKDRNSKVNKGEDVRSASKKPRSGVKGLGQKKGIKDRDSGSSAVSNRRSAPKNDNRISPKLLRLARKTLSSSNLETARSEKKKLKKAKNLREALLPVVEKLKKTNVKLDKSLASLLDPKPGGKPKVQNKMAKVREVPTGKGTSEQVQWFHSAYTDHVGTSVAALEEETLKADHFLEIPGRGELGEAALPALALHAKTALLPLWDCQVAPGECVSGGGKEAGSPLLLVVCPSAQRCTEVLRSLKELGGKHGFAKLFAKHMKVEEQVEFLKKPCIVAAGTPARIERLASLGALSLGSLKVFALDLFRTPKGLTVLDIPETRADFWDLYQKHLKPLVVGGTTKLCLV